MSPTRSSRAAAFGADADELERAAARLRGAADDLDGQANSLTAALRSVAWIGGVAVRFHGDWHGSHRPRLVSTARYLRAAATELDRNAADQRNASAAHAGQVAGSRAASPGDQRATERLVEVLGALGLGRRAIELAITHVDLLDDDVASRAVAFLTSPGLATLVRESDHVVDVAGVVLDVLADLDDHADLPVDERLVHALADAAIRFGMQEGAEHGIELLTASVTAALLPGFGAALAPVVGQASGAIAEQLFHDAIAVIDEQTDVVDWGADRAVELYRIVMAGVDGLVDLGEAALAIADGALDLAGDVSDWIDDQVDDVGDLLVDGAGAVGDFVIRHLPGLG